MLEGALTFGKILKPMDSYAEGVMGLISEKHRYSGLLSVRLTVTEGGTIGKLDVLSSNLLDSLGNLIPKSELEGYLRSPDVRFPRARGKSILTLPLLIQR